MHSIVNGQIKVIDERFAGVQDKRSADSQLNSKYLCALGELCGLGEKSSLHTRGTGSTRGVLTKTTKLTKVFLFVERLSGKLEECTEALRLLKR